MCTCSEAPLFARFHRSPVSSASESECGARVGRPSFIGAYAPSRSVQVTGPPRAGAGIDCSPSANAIGCFAPIVTRATALDLCVGRRARTHVRRSEWRLEPGERIGAPACHPWRRSVRGSDSLLGLHLVLDLAATVRQFHPRFVIAGVGQVYDIPVVGGSLAGGLQLEL